MPNFDPNSVTGLLGLWDFMNSDPDGDTGTDDGISQDGSFENGASASGDRANFDGSNDRFDVDGDNGGPAESVFDLAAGTIEVQFTQDQHIGSSPDTIVNRGEFDDRNSEGYFNIAVHNDGSVVVTHFDGDGNSATLCTVAGIVDPSDLINVKYTWDETTGATLVVENLTDGTTSEVSTDQTGLTMDIGDNDDEIFTFGAREDDDGDYDQFFDGSIDYVAIYESANAEPDGVVDGEDFGEVMELGYDDANAPTDQGGDMITNGDDVIFGNGGDDTIDGADGNDTIIGDGATGGDATSEIFQWEEAPNFGDGNTAAGFTQNTGTAEISFSFTSVGNVDNTYEDTTQNVDDLDPSVATNASFESLLNNNSESATYNWDSENGPLENVQFRINDLDGDGRVVVRAFDADGNPIEVVLSDAGSGLALSDTDGVAGNDTATSIDNNYTNDASAEHSVLVTIPGPVTSWEIEHQQDGGNASGINFTDITFDALQPVAEPGDDVITGGDGDDITYGDNAQGFGTLTVGEQIADQDGEGGDDTFLGSEGADQSWGEGGDDTFIIDSIEDAAGDVVVGGNGPDDTADNDVLDLRGTGQVTIDAVDDGTDTGAQSGTVTFADGSTLQFFQIETILTDPQNEAPTANDDDITVDEDSSVTFDPTANDTDPDGDELEVDSFTQPDNGTVTQNPDGTLTYTPDPNYKGSDSFEVTITDPSGATSTSTVNVTVDPVNDAPDAVADTASMDEDGDAITIDVLDNDTDIDGDDLTITEASVPSEQGSVDIVNNELVFTPAPDFNGPATITYAISDGNGGTDTAAVTVDVAPVNDDPVAVDDILDTLEEEPITFNPAVNDTDVDGDDLIVTDASVDPSEGTVTVDPDTGEVTFTPAENFTGPATITYTVSDGNGGTDEGTSVVNVGNVIDPPTANDDDATTDEDVAVTIDVLANDTDPENQDLTVTAANVDDPNLGTVDIVNNELVFTPAENFNGTATITYSIVDTEGGTDTATVTVVIDPVNDLPVAVDDILNTDEDVPITFNPAENDTDVETPTADLVVVDATVDPAFGTVEVNPDGTVTFTPAEDYNGPAPITYVVEDEDGGQDTGTALVNVGPVNDAPEPEDDAAVIDQGTPVTIMVLDNDSDPDNTVDELTVIAASVPPAQGTVTFDGTTVTFTPAPDFVGVADISYTIADPDGLTGSANIEVTVNDVIGPVDGTDDGELMTPGYEDFEGDEIDGDDGLNDTIFGNGGDDTIDGGEGNDTIDGGADDDDITGGAGDDDVMGGEGSDTLAGGEGADTLDGGLGDDDIAVKDGDEASGGSGDDVFTLDDTDPATDIDGITIDGGSDGTDGNPDDDANGDEGDVLDLSDVDDDLEVVFDDDDPEDGTVDGLDTDGAPDITFEEIERVITGEGDDVIEGGDSDGPIDVTTNGGDDTITGTDGDDVVDSGDDDDEVTTGTGSDTIDGGDGDNVINAGDNNPDLLDDKNGDGFGFGPFGPLPGIDVDDDPDDDRDLVTTGSGDDIITTGDDADTIFAGDGENVIDSGIDNDEVTTGDGDDLITTGEGADTVIAGGGNDTIYGGLGPSLGGQFDIPDEGSFPNGGDPDTENGRDSLDGGDGNDLIFGEDDDDTLIGGSGDDTLDGGIDDDSLTGGADDDELIGGQGADTMSGGDDQDTFLVNGAGDGIGDVIDGGDGGVDFDTLDLRGSQPENGSLQVTFTSADEEDGFVTYFNEDGDEVGTLVFEEIENVIPCFTPGTLIATPTGERRVEHLEVGDRVITRDNGIQEIRWVGHREMSGDELAQAPQFNPVLIRAGALGRGLPERDMLVSPQHRVLVTGEQPAMYFEESEVLVAAKHLTHMDGIDVVEVSGTTYIHVMFDQHEVILSDGAWTESFQPGDMTLSAMGEAQRAEIIALFPELETADGVEGYTAARRALKKHEAKLLSQ